eukprot:Opistho-1_new@52084
MHKTKEETRQFLLDLETRVGFCSIFTGLALPFTLIETAVAVRSFVQIGAQNMHEAVEGAYTGEISGRMLKDVGASFVLLGHSERRRLFGETNSLLNQKIKRAIQEGIKPVYCLGESETERAEGQTEAVLEKQLREGLMGLEEEQISGLVVAYEPIWAIGSGKAASPEEAGQAHAFCRSFLKKQWGSIGEKVPILYGGSVKPEGVSQLLRQEGIDGVLVGGASLEVDSFIQIIHNANQENCR